MRYRQVIIARKDLNMSAGKLSAQVSHASIAFLTQKIKRCYYGTLDNDNIVYTSMLYFEKEMWDEWLTGSFTKTICEAKNRNHLMKAVKIAEDLGLLEGEDYFLIKDSCLTELEPEEYDENGVGRCLTCIGFRPLPDEIAHKISKKFQLYK